MTRMKVTVGRLLCRQVRDFLKEARLVGWDIDYVESSGLIERDFTIIGPSSDLRFVKSALDNWADEQGVKHDH